MVVGPPHQPRELLTWYLSDMVFTLQGIAAWRGKGVDEVKFQDLYLNFRISGSEHLFYILDF